MKVSRKKTYSSFLLLVFGVFFLISCKEQSFYDYAYDFEDRTWDISDTAYFDFEVDDTLTQYDMILTLRTSVNYPYSNLWVHILSTAPDGSRSKVAQRIPLAASDGSWLGRVTGTTVESKLRYTTTDFPLKGKYRIGVVHAIQDDQVDEVLDISLRIQEKKKK